MSASSSEADPQDYGIPGQYQAIKISDLVILEHLQRKPAMSRIRQMARLGWRPDKMGILLVARIKINGKWVYHVYDGGHRYTLAQYLKLHDMVVPCWVIEMTEEEAARRFDHYNSESKKPSALDHFKVGCVYGEPHQVAIKKAFDMLNLRAGSHANYLVEDDEDADEPYGVVAALTACKTIVKNVVTEVNNGKRSGVLDESVDPWDRAVLRLYEVFEFTRTVYENEDAHDSDFIQAVARLRAAHGKPFSGAIKKRLAAFLQQQSAAGWRSDALELATGVGGSESRAGVMARHIATEYNAEQKSKSTCLRMVAASSRARRAAADEDDDEDAA